MTSFSSSLHDPVSCGRSVYRLFLDNDEYDRVTEFTTVPRGTRRKINDHKAYPRVLSESMRVVLRLVFHEPCVRPFFTFDQPLYCFLTPTIRLADFVPR